MQSHCEECNDKAGAFGNDFTTFYCGGGGGVSDSRGGLIYNEAEKVDILKEDKLKSEKQFVNSGRRWVKARQYNARYKTASSDSF